MRKHPSNGMPTETFEVSSASYRVFFAAKTLETILKSLTSSEPALFGWTQICKLLWPVRS
jgi:hypothetical protein